jgi:hypothetical protein
MSEQLENKMLKDIIKYAKESPKGVFQAVVGSSLIEVTIIDDYESSYHQKMEEALRIAEKNGKIIKKHIKGEIDTVNALKAVRNARGKAIKA